MEYDLNDTPQNETIEQPNAALNQCTQELADTKNRLVSLAAEFQNYQKRTDQERIQWMNAAQNKVMLDILSIIDDFDRAFEQFTPEQRQANQSWLQGFELINKGAQKILQKYDIQEMPVSGEFNPEAQEALMHVASDSHNSGEVVAVLQKGYMHKNTILRPAKVSVAQ